MAIRIDADQRRARLAARHHLLAATRTDDLTQIADDLVALHSSDPVSVYLSAAARLVHPSLTAIEQALYADRTLIRHHGMRRTLWVATPEVARLIHAAATRDLVPPEHRRVAKLLRESGVEEPDVWLDEARRQTLADLAEHGASTARAVGERVPILRQPLVLAAGTKFEATVAAHTRLLLLLGFEGAILRARPTGTWINGAYRYAPTADWLPGGLGDREPADAAAELTRRWLWRFGPATTTDLQWWTGWTVVRTRRALVDAGAVAVELEGGPGWVAADDQPVAEPGPWVAVLPSLDPTTMGWKARSWYLPEAAAGAFDSRGNAGPTVWVDGRVVGAWAQTKQGELRTHYFEPVPAARRREVDERLAVLRSTVGETRFTVRFPGAVQPQILADP